jgi:hypothetical protein
MKTSQFILLAAMVVAAIFISNVIIANKVSEKISNAPGQLVNEGKSWLSKNFGVNF